MYRLTLADREVNTHARTNTTHSPYLGYIQFKAFSLVFFPLKDWSSIPWYRWKNMAACVRAGVCEKCKVSNWFGVVSLMHFFVRMDNVHMPCINVCICTLLHFTFHFLGLYPFPFSSPSFHPNSSYRCHTIKKYWNNIKLQTYFPNSISLYDKPYSHVPFLAQGRCGLMLSCFVVFSFFVFCFR